MNSIQRTWYKWKHGGKVASAGRKPNIALPYFTVEGRLELGDHTHFRNNATFRAHGDGRIVFGDRCGASWGCLIEARERVQIDNYVGIAEYTHITDSMPDLSAPPGPDGRMAWRTAPVRIHERAFIGSGVFIGPGVTVGENAVITPHSVVTRDVGPLEVWGGSPARKYGHRINGVPESIKREVEEAIEASGIGLDRYYQAKPTLSLAGLRQKLFGRRRDKP